MSSSKKNKKPKKTSRPSSAAKKKTPAKLVLARRKPSPQKASRKKRVRAKAAEADMVSFERRDRGARSGGQAGDAQGLSSVKGAAWESVEELLKEGDAYEAEVVKSAWASNLAKPDNSTRQSLQDAWSALFPQESWALLAPATRAEMLVSAGRKFLEVYKKSGARADLALARALWGGAVLASGLEAAQSALIIPKAGGLLLDVYEQTRLMDDLNEAVEWQLTMLRDVGLSALDQADALYHLGNRLRRIYRDAGDGRILDRAVQCHKRAVELGDPEAPNLPDLYDALAIGLKTRYGSRGDPADLDEAVVASQRAIQLATVQPDFNRGYLADYMLNLGSAVGTRFERTKAINDIDQAIESFDGALRLAPDEWESTGVARDCLARTLEIRYQNRHNLQDLDRALDLRRKILGSNPANSPGFNEAQALLARGLSVRYEERRQRADLDEAIAMLRSVLSAQAMPGRQAAESAKLLATLLHNRHLLTSDLKDLQDAIAWTRYVVESAPSEETALTVEMLARLAGELGLLFRATKVRAHLDEGIDCARQALALSPGDAQVRAELNAELGADLLIRAATPAGDSNHIGDLEGAIEALRQAVALAQQGSKELPHSLHNLAVGLRMRFADYGSQADLVEAISVSRRAARLSADSAIIGWTFVDLMADAPTEIREMPLAETPGMVQWIREMDESLTEAIRDGDEQKATAERIALASLLLEVRAGVDTHAEPIEDAIRLVEDSLRSAVQPMPEQPGGPHDMLCRAYALRTKGLKAENMEASVTHGIAAVELTSRVNSPELWAACHTNLAAAYRERILSEEAENIELAIRHFGQALEVRTRERFPVQWAMLQNSLGIAYLTRVRESVAENIEKAIKYFENALEVRRPNDFPGKRADTESNLAGAYLERSAGDRSANIEEAIGYALSALKVRTRERFPNQWALAQSILGAAYLDRVEGVSAENLRHAAGCFDGILEILQRDSDPGLWAGTHYNAALVALRRDTSEEAAERAIAHYRQALEVYTRDAFPIDHLKAQQSLGEVLSKLRHWEPALDALEAAVATAEMVYAQAFTEAGRRSEVARTGDLYAMNAWCLLHLGKPSRALERLEEGRTRLLSEALALRELDVRALPAEQQERLRSLRHAIHTLDAEMRLPPNTPARRDDRTLAQALSEVRAELRDTIEGVRKVRPYFMHKGLELAAILALIPRDGALVAPVVTSEGSAVIIVPSGMQSVGSDQVLWLKDFNESDFSTLLLGPEHAQLGSWLRAYFSKDMNTKAWLDTIEGTLQKLWVCLMGPIAARLAALGAHHVLLIPQGRLGLLPLHAAWHEAEGERHYFLDDYTVTYVPSAYVRRVSVDRVQELARQAHTALAVVNPTGDLPFARFEGAQLERLFPAKQLTMLAGSEATGEAIKRSVASYLHFACHGFYRWEDAMQSGLILANREPLTLTQIIGDLNLDATRLVTLSACETGLTDILKAPDEYLGLPAGFLQAGAPAVVGTLWAVSDLSTMLLIEHFYDLHLNQWKELVEALRDAQIWLRSLTGEELAERFSDDLQAAMLGDARIPLETASSAYARFAFQDSGIRPFAHPFHWAAFTFSGA